MVKHRELNPPGEHFFIGENMIFMKYEYEPEFLLLKIHCPKQDFMNEI